MGLCSYDVGSLSRRTGSKPWSSEEMWSLQRGEACSFGTTALSNYEVQLVAQVEGGRFPWLVNADGGSRSDTCGCKPGSENSSTERGGVVF